MNSRRFIPIFGLILLIVGYSYLTFESFQLDNEIENKQEELEQLEEKIRIKNTALSIKEDQLEATREIVMNKVPSLATKLDSIDLFYRKRSEKIENNKEALYQITPEENQSLQKAQEWEAKGFDLLLQKDVDNAIKAFINSENAYNGYNSVYEISKYLKNNRDSLSSLNSKLWNKTYGTIANEYSWRMNPKVKQQLKLRSTPDRGVATEER